MYSLGLLIVDLETARRRLLEVFEVPDGKRTNEFRTPPILAACQNPHLDLFAADTGGLLRLYQPQGTGAKVSIRHSTLGRPRRCKLSTATCKNGDPVR